MCTAERERERDGKCVVHVAETFGETKGGKSQRLALAEAGRKARRALSLGSQQQGQTGSDSDSSGDFEARPPHPHQISGNMDN